MNSFKLPITFEEFERHYVPFGWKDEYIDGTAYITPYEISVLMKLLVTKPAQIELMQGAMIKPVTEVSLEALYELFYLAFSDSVEFCDQSKQEVKYAAKTEIDKFFNGKRGIPELSLCCVIALPNTCPSLIGACLISKYQYGYKNEMIFIHPAYQRKQIGAALINDVLRKISGTNESFLWSEHDIANEVGQSWHRKMGFIEVTDIQTARIRRKYYRRELNRQKLLNNQTAVLALTSQLEIAEKEVARLTELEKSDFDAAWVRWKYNY